MIETSVATKKKYVFDHVPKTGGTSLREVFARLFGKNGVTPVLTGTVADAVAKYGDLPMIIGHFWHTPRGLAPERAFLTFLRQPEDWLLSHYWFSRNQAGASDEQAVFYAKSMSFEEYVSSTEPDVLVFTRNFQTRHFVRLKSLQHVTEMGEQQALSFAKEAIDAYEFVGICEEFQDSVDLMCHRFGWPFVQDIPNRNTTPRREKLENLDPSLRKRLRQLNGLDIELYEYAKARFMAGKRKVFAQFLARNDPVDNIGVTSVPDQVPQDSPQALPLDFGDKSVEITKTEVAGAGSSDPAVKSGEDATVLICVRAHNDIEDLTVGLEIRDWRRQSIFGTNSRVLGHNLTMRSGQEMEFRYKMRMDLGKGKYSITVALHSGLSHLERCYHWKEEAARFNVTQSNGTQFTGVVRLVPSLEVR